MFRAFVLALLMFAADVYLFQRVCHVCQRDHTVNNFFRLLFHSVALKLF